MISKNKLSRGEVLILIELILNRKKVLYSQLAGDLDWYWTIQILHKLEEKLSKYKCLEGN